MTRYVFFHFKIDPLKLVSDNASSGMASGQESRSNLTKGHVNLNKVLGLPGL